MTPLRFILARPFAVLATVVVLWLVLPAATRRLTRVSFYEFSAPAGFAASYARDLQQYWALRTRSTNELIETARDLAYLNAQYEVRIHENETLRAEVARLEQLLQLPALPEYRIEAARILRRDFNTWWQRLEIRKGRNHGIPEGAPVVFSGGIVGVERQGQAHRQTVYVAQGSRGATVSQLLAPADKQRRDQLIMLRQTRQRGANDRRIVLAVNEHHGSGPPSTSGP